MVRRAEDAEDAESEGTEPDPRVSFANERTFLAWIRTALALIAGGIAVVQVVPPFDIPGARRVIGIPLILLGAGIAFTSAGRWEARQRALRLRRPLPTTRLIPLVAAGVGATAAVAAVFALFS